MKKIIAKFLIGIIGGAFLLALIQAHIYWYNDFGWWCVIILPAAILFGIILTLLMYWISEVLKD